MHVSLYVLGGQYCIVVKNVVWRSETTHLEFCGLPPLNLFKFYLLQQRSLHILSLALHQYDSILTYRFIISVIW